MSPGLSASTGNELNARFNVRVGTTLRLAEDFLVVVGAFTDRDNAPWDEATASGPVHFYGGVVGAQWGKIYDVDDDEGRKPLEFTTTLALRYAYGHGDTGGLRVTISDVGGTRLPAGDVEQSKLRVHEIMLHLGSGFYF